MIKTLTTVLVVLAFLQVAVFIGRYLLTDWFRKPMGRHAMGFMAVCLIVLGLAVSRELFGAEWAGRDAVRLLSYALINGIFAWRLVLLFGGQRSPH